MIHNRKYLQKMLESPLPPLSELPEDERIYLDVPYMARDYAKYCRCRFDPEKKLWFAGVLHRHLSSLVSLYGVHEATSDKARRLLQEKLAETPGQGNQGVDRK